MGKESEQLQELTLETIEAAAAGDREAIERIVANYAADIDAICTKQTWKRNGQAVFHIDEDMRHEIVRRLIADLPALAARLRAEAMHADAPAQSPATVAVSTILKTDS